MYHKQSEGWIKHFDFILLDMICLQLAFVVAYFVRHGFSNPYNTILYRNVALMLALVQIISTIFGNNFKNVLHRGIFKEFEATIKQVAIVTSFGIFYLFLVKSSSAFSRVTMLMLGVFYLLFSYIFRLIWKTNVRQKMLHNSGKKSLILITTASRAEDVVKKMRDTKAQDYQLTGVVLMDENRRGDVIGGLEVIANISEVVQFVCHNWVDEVFINMEWGEYLSQEIIDAFNQMGVTTHVELQGLDNPYHRMQTVQKILGHSVLTYSVVNIPENELIWKRVMDVVGGFVGCLLCIILTIIIGPIIFIASPGPIFFSQTRIGRNGKPFKMYKFRSMYMGAEKQKKELEALNEASDGMMFKIAKDPRIIKGIGHFIRRTSLDEFPQFWNVLLGDMSLVGTRPPTPDEWIKYDLHHRLRMVMRPGITGLWQVSDKKEIREFEEVVRLDAEYISKWNIGLDIRIMLKTIGAMFKNC